MNQSIITASIVTTIIGLLFGDMARANEMPINYQLKAGKVLETVVSGKNSNIIRLQDDRISDLVLFRSNGVQVSANEDTGEIYVRWQDNALERQELTLYSEKGKRQDLILVRKDVPGQIIYLHDYKSKTAPNAYEAKATIGEEANENLLVEEVLATEIVEVKAEAAQQKPMQTKIQEQSEIQSRTQTSDYDSIITKFRAGIIPEGFKQVFELKSDEELPIPQSNIIEDRYYESDELLVRVIYLRAGSQFDLSKIKTGTDSVSAMLGNSNGYSKFIIVRGK